MENLSEKTLAKALQILIDHYDKDDSFVFSKLKTAGINDSEALDIFAFMPAAFVRILLPDVEYAEGYSTLNGERKRFADTASFQTIFDFSLKHISTLDGPSMVMVAARGAEFRAINQLLEEGTALEDIQLSEMVLTKPA